MNKEATEHGAEPQNSHEIRSPQPAGCSLKVVGRDWMARQCAPLGGGGGVGLTAFGWRAACAIPLKS